MHDDHGAVIGPDRVQRVRLRHAVGPGGLPVGAAGQDDAVSAANALDVFELEAIANLNIHLQIETKGDWRTSINFVGAPVASTALPR